MTEPDHLIIAVAPTAMRILDCETNETLAIATATGCCGSYTWTVHADGLEDVTTKVRTEAIAAMIDHAVMSTGGFSTLVPRALIEQSIGAQ